MILDSQWIFALAESMPNNTTAVLSGAKGFSGYIDWTTSKWRDWINSSMPLWLVVTCNTVPEAGTSIQMLVYQHSTTTLGSGDLLLSGEDVPVANLAAGRHLLCVPVMSCLCQRPTDALRDQYFGIVQSGTGDVSTGKIDAYLHIGANPPIEVDQPAIQGASNITLPA